MGTELGNKNYVEKEDVTKEQIRCLVSSVYDLQKVRIAIGNRVVASFYLSLGIKPSEKKVIRSGNGDSDKDDEEKKRKQTLMLLRKEYKRVSDYIIENIKSIKKSISEINSSKSPLEWIRSESDYRLIESYNKLLSAEEAEIKILEKFVKAHPMWDAFFKDIKGCGTLMSAVCLAYLDPHKARHVSSFYKYAGLDAVNDTDKYGNTLFWNPDRSKKLRQKVMFVTEFGDSYAMEEVKALDSEDEVGNELYMSYNGEICTKEFVTVVIDGEDVNVYEDVNTGEDYIGDVVVSQHGRRMSDTEMYEYTSKDGTVKLKRGITYNPALKEKLMGVLAGCLLKAKSPKYATIYYDYRARIDACTYHKGKKDRHKFLMAERYMIKQFLRDMWVTWRELEGLPVDLPYEVEKLGHEPHALNAYQCEVARRSLGAYPEDDSK